MILPIGNLSDFRIIYFDKYKYNIDKYDVIYKINMYYDIKTNNVRILGPYTYLKHKYKIKCSYNNDNLYKCNICSLKSVDNSINIKE